MKVGRNNLRVECPARPWVLVAARSFTQLFGFVSEVSRLRSLAIH
jgi:hypothetical protein